jgi:6-phosphogluconolactonase
MRAGRNSRTNGSLTNAFATAGSRFWIAAGVISCGCGKVLHTWVGSYQKKRQVQRCSFRWVNPAGRASGTCDEIFIGIAVGQSFFFWGDERHVPPDSPDSNYRMANETLLSKLPIPSKNIFRIPAELPDAREAARQYAETLENFFKPQPNAFPRFDFILLGMGPDGHTASLFPGTAALQDQDHFVAANWVEKLNTFRITFTYPVLNNAASVMFLVSGDEKAEMVRRALKDPSAKLPCQSVRPENGEVVWFLDKGAAVKL